MKVKPCRFHCAIFFAHIPSVSYPLETSLNKSLALGRLWGYKEKARGVAQPGERACLGSTRSPVRIRPPRPPSFPVVFFVKTFRRAIGPRFALICCVLVWLGDAAVARAEQTAKITILHVNDPHAHYEPYAEKGTQELVGGGARMASVMARVHQEAAQENRTVFSLLAGDLLTGTPFSTVFKGRMGVALMNAMGFTAMTVGNHEFDYGQANLREIREGMKFSLLSANIVDEKGEPVFPEMIERWIPGTDIRVLIFGLTTADTPFLTFPDNVKGLEFKDPLETARRRVQKAGDSDLVIAVTHLGLNEDIKLAQACPRINVIVGGHSHTALFEPQKVNETLVCQAGAYAKYVGRLDLEFSKGKILTYSGRLILLDSSIPEDEKTAELIAAFKTQLDKTLDTVIGHTRVFLDGTLTGVRSDHPTNLGRLLCYLMAQAAGAKAAFVNGGCIRQSILEGQITAMQVYTALPFPSGVFRIDLSGADLQEVLQRSMDLPSGHGGKLQTWGIEYTREDGKVFIRSVGGVPFDPTATYTLATNDFLVAGGDGYTVLKERGVNLYDTSTPLSDLLIGFIKEQGVITEQLLVQMGVVIP